MSLRRIAAVAACVGLSACSSSGSKTDPYGDHSDINASVDSCTVSNSVFGVDLSYTIHNRTNVDYVVTPIFDVNGHELDSSRYPAVKAPPHSDTPKQAVLQITSFAYSANALHCVVSLVLS